MPAYYQVFLIVLLVVCTLVGYRLITRVPSLLHTPLMSGMNAFSGVTVLGCLSATAFALRVDYPVLASVLGILAIAQAMINVVGGFSVTHRMLRLFRKQPKQPLSTPDQSLDGSNQADQQ